MAGFSPQDSYCIWGDMGDWGGGGGGWVSKEERNLYLASTFPSGRGLPP